MTLTSVFSLLGGVGLFLYGMTVMSSGLRNACGDNLQTILEKATSNKFMAVFVGFAVTILVQSSSATDIMVIGFVNSGMMSLSQAIGVIMGANIGTTITAHILRLSDLQTDNFFLMLLKPKSLAPLAMIVGILFFMSAKRDRQKNIGVILLGFGVLFTGMFAMEGAVAPLSNEPWFTSLFATFRNPVIGILVGTFVTAAIQSSAASIGILQALTSTGLITYSMAFPIIMGQNIGTCITPILASIGASKNAKRTAAVHVSFNILGTIIFVIGCYTFQHFVGFSFWDAPIDKGGIANFHTIFNVTVTLIFIPLVGLLEKIARTIVRDKPGDRDQEITAITLDERLLVSPGLAVEHAREAVVQMANIARQNYLSAIGLLFEYDPKVVERINENEDVVDKLEDRVETYLLRLGERELSDSENRSISELLHTCGEFERVADHAENICECADRMFETKTKFSKKATEEMQTICEAVKEILDLAVDAFQKVDRRAAASIAPLEEVVDEMEQLLKDKHIDRLRRGKCTVDAAFPYVEALSNIERIADLCSNVGESVLTYDSRLEEIDRHEYKRLRGDQHDGGYQAQYTAYTAKYYGRLKKKAASE